MALIMLPTSVREVGAPPYRPVVALCASSDGGVAASELMAPDALEPTCLLHAIARFALEPLVRGAPPLGYLPSRVRMPAKGDAATNLVENVLASTGVSVQRTDDLTYFLAAAHFIGECTEGSDAAPLSMPGLMAAKGMTIDRVRGCAEAMALFCAAAPWRTLADEVPWRIQPAPTTPAMRTCIVTGALGEQIGLAFLPSIEDFAAMHIMPAITGVPYLPRTTLWTVMLEPLESAPEADIELWRREGLPLCELPAIGAASTPAKSKAPSRSHSSAAGRGRGSGATSAAVTVPAIPLPVGVTATGRVLRPTLAQIVLMEALLRGFAATDASELRRDPLRFAVQTCDGARKLTLRR